MGCSRRSNSMSRTRILNQAQMQRHQIEWHKILKGRTFSKDEVTRPSYKIFPTASQKNYYTCSVNAEQLQECFNNFNARASSEDSQQCHLETMSSTLQNERSKTVQDRWMTKQDGANRRRQDETKQDRRNKPGQDNTRHEIPASDVKARLWNMNDKTRRDGRNTAHYISRNRRDPDRGPHFVRACAVEMQLGISQEPLCAEFAGKMPRPGWSTLIKHRPLHSP